MKRNCLSHRECENRFHEQFNFKIKLPQFLTNYIMEIVYAAHFGHVETIIEMYCLQ
jgi:hypothetical protein